MTARRKALEEHIHRLLDEHVVAHLATNYTDYTQLQVYQALTGLPVPAEDTHSFLPPSDPLDSLAQGRWHIEPQKAWESLSLITAKEAQELITRTIRAAPFKQTDFLDTFCTFSPHLHHDPGSPVLTVRSIRLTPRIGHSGVTPCTPVDLGGVSRWCRMELEEDFGPSDVGVMTEDVIHSPLTVNYSSKELVSRSPFFTPQCRGAEHSLSRAFLHRTPSPTISSYSPHTPPLFSRSNASLGIPAPVPITMADLPLITPLAASDDDGGSLDIADQWSVPTMSSPPTSSLDDCLRGHDEIFAPSSDSPESVVDLLATEMDAVCMPRESRVRGFHGVLNAPGQHQRLHEYIGTIVDLTSVATASLDIRQHSDDTEDNPFCLFSGDYLKVIDSDSFDCAEETGLMDVPRLPAPNVHTRTVTCSSDFGSFLAHQNFSFFCVVKGIKSLNLELTWRPYSSEQAIPTLEELVGVSDFYHFLTNSCFDTEEDKSLLTDLLNMPLPLTRPVSIEEENQRGMKVILCATAESDSSAINHTSMDGSDSNVLLTRAERRQSRLLHRPHLERDRGHTGQWDVSTCSTQLHISENVMVGGLSECVCCRDGTSYTQLNSVHTGLPAYSHPLLTSPLGVSSTGSGGTMAQHVQLSARPAATVLPPASPSQDHVLITGLETPRVPGPSRLHSFGGHEADRNYLPSSKASSRSTVYEQQSLGDYLTILVNKRLPGPSHDIPTSPTFAEQHRVSPPLFDIEPLLWELTSMTASFPPMQAPPLRNHRYLSSVEILQDRPLMGAFRHDWLRIDLLEREWLNGADVVFDCDTALVFSPLHLLLSDSRSLKGRLGLLSWKYTRLAIIFKLYGDSVSGLRYPQPEKGHGDFSARLIRSFKKLCRDIAIAEAYGEKRPQTDIQMYFARSDEEAATMARTLGDMAESQSQWGPWDDRLWLGADEQEEEPYLASVDGMNAFAAAAVLSQISLHDFLALSPNQRLQLALRIPVAEAMIERLNEAISQRREDFNNYVSSEDGDSEMHGA